MPRVIVYMGTEVWIVNQDRATELARGGFIVFYESIGWCGVSGLSDAHLRNIGKGERIS